MSHLALSVWTIVNDAGQWLAIVPLIVTVLALRRRVQGLERRLNEHLNVAHAVRMHQPPPPHPAFDDVTYARAMQREAQRRGMRL